MDFEQLKTRFLAEIQQLLNHIPVKKPPTFYLGFGLLNPADILLFRERAQESAFLDASQLPKDIKTDNWTHYLFFLNLLAVTAIQERKSLAMNIYPMANETLEKLLKLIKLLGYESHIIAFKNPHEISADFEKNISAEDFQYLQQHNALHLEALFNAFEDVAGYSIDWFLEQYELSGNVSLISHNGELWGRLDKAENS